MYHVVHLLLFFCFAGTKKKGLLNFVSERIIFLKLVYRINDTRYSFKKNKLPFKLVKPHFIAGLPRARSARGTEPHTHGMWSTSFRLVVT